MLMNINPHTVILLIGPTECGKSTFANEVLVPQLSYSDSEKNFNMNVQVISSDQIRRDLLGFNYDKHDAIMTEASEQAFDLLELKLNTLTSFPINAEYVIVDTKGLSEEFRKQVVTIAKNNHYHVDAVVFDYKETQDFYMEGTKNKRSVAMDVRRLRSDVLANLRKEGFSQVHRVKGKNFLNEEGKANPEYQVQIPGLELYLSTILPASQNEDYFIVGDVHEELDALKKVFAEKGFIVDGDELLLTPKSQDKIAILVGDIIDKGGNTEGVIRFVHKNRKYIKLVRGNHENFVYKYLKGMLTDVNLPEDLIPSQFTSIEVLEKDEELRNLFFELVESSVEHYRYIGVWKRSFYVTHAPCLKKYLGKVDNVSLKNQRNFMLDREADIEKQLNFLKVEAVGNHPYHVFGHVASANAIRIKNKLGIDTGAAYGNRLLSVSIADKLYFKSFAVEKDEKAELPFLFERRQQAVSLDDLSDDDRRRLHYVLRNKINFISGTISPADKNEETGELESLAKGLEYYKHRGVKKVTLQPKYMGSRCTIYLSKTLEDCYAVSRNGYKIRNINLNPVFEQQIARHSAMLEENQMIVLDGELMPWMALGKGLIEREFKVIDVALGQEIEFLQASGFENQLLALNTTFARSEFAQDQSNMSKKDLIEKYGMATYGAFKNVKEVMKTYTTLDVHEEAYKNYHEQIELFGVDSEIMFKPFALLKTIAEDGTESFPTQATSEVFNQISDDEFVVVDFEDPNYFDQANSFYQSLTTDRRMEGVVVKPEFQVDSVAPTIKVRNPEYLRIIYGYDYTFPHKYEKLFAQKNIGKKLATSISEHQLGKQMLAFLLKDIEKDNRDYQQVVANMLFETSKESGIDPRL